MKLSDINFRMQSICKECMDETQVSENISIMWNSGQFRS